MPRQETSLNKSRPSALLQENSSEKYFGKVSFFRTNMPNLRVICITHDKRRPDEDLGRTQDNFSQIWTVQTRSGRLDSLELLLGCMHALCLWLGCTRETLSSDSYSASTAIHPALAAIHRKKPSTVKERRETGVFYEVSIFL